jgi:hypothetical protein
VAREEKIESLKPIDAGGEKIEIERFSNFMGPYRISPKISLILWRTMHSTLILLDLNLSI